MTAHSKRALVLSGGGAKGVFKYFLSIGEDLDVPAENARGERILRSSAPLAVGGAGRTGWRCTHAACHRI